MFLSCKPVLFKLLGTLGALNVQTIFLWCMPPKVVLTGLPNDFIVYYQICISFVHSVFFDYSRMLLYICTYLALAQQTLQLPLRSWIQGFPFFFCPVVIEVTKPENSWQLLTETFT